MIHLPRQVLAAHTAELATDRTLIVDIGSMACRDLHLSRNGFTADAAVLAFGHAILGTGRCNCLVDHFRVTVGSKNFLCNSGLLTNSTVFTLGQARFGTCGGNRIIDHFGVTLRIYVVAYIAVVTAAGIGRVASFRTSGRRYDLRITMHMWQDRNRLRLGFAAAQAGMELFTRRSFRCRNLYYAFIPVMIPRFLHKGMTKITGNAVTIRFDGVSRHDLHYGLTLIVNRYPTLIVIFIYRTVFGVTNRDDITGCQSQGQRFTRHLTGNCAFRCAIQLND